MTELPVADVLPEVGRLLADNRPVVLQAPPGSGKTTLVAPSLLDAPWLEGRRIILLEPRRLAARAACRYMAAMLGEEVGERVGYHVRLERRVGPRTRIEVLTEGLLVQRLLGDPELLDAAVVIFDEFHERSIFADFGLALALDSRAALRPDLRLLVMSATIEAEPIAAHLGNGAVVTAEGRVWPVDTRYLPRNSEAPVPRQAADAVRRALIEEQGSMLVFLPGEGEIHRTASLLAESPLPPDTSVHPLYGSLPRQAQEAAVEPAPPGRRKVVLATSIAESSLTIAGIRVVIDTGWMRVPRFSPRNGMSRLETLRVTADRADQRAGRAGRLGPGICWRLWDSATQRRLAPSGLPEILDADLAPLVLQAADWGATRREGLPWFTAPPDAAWRQASDLLRDLGAIDEAGRPTTRGRLMARLPVHPRLSHMILQAEARGCPRTACLLAAAVVEAAAESSLRRETDARRLLDRLEGGDCADHAPRDWAARVRQLAGQWARPYPPRDRGTVEAGRMLSWAFPDRIAQRREQPGLFRLSGGRGGILDTADSLASEPWLAVAEIQDDGPDARIRLAAPIALEWIEEDFASRIVSEERVIWDRRQEAIAAVRRDCLGGLTLREAPLRHPAPEAVASALLDGIRSKGVANLAWDAASRNLQGRILLLRRARPEEDWPDVSDAALTVRLAEWLLPWLTGLTRWEQVQRVDLAPALLALLGSARRELDRLAPTHIEVPSGSHIRIDYAHGEEPVLAVRVQEVFGLNDTPRVAGGRVPVLLHLLSPAHRPVQVTRDLASFWRQGYGLVRKELRGRYPRHDWPEDPTVAVPSRRPRRPAR